MPLFFYVKNIDSNRARTIGLTRTMDLGDSLDNFYENNYTTLP
jgi:hypothetical protein